MELAYKLVRAFVAAGLLIAFIAPVVLKLKDPALGAVILLGVSLMLIDLWQAIALRRKGAGR